MATESHVCPSHEAVICAELGPTEKLLWAGPARWGIVFRAVDWILIPFGLLWCAMIVSGFIANLGRGAQALPLDIILAVFFCAGVHLMLSRSLVDAWRRQRSTYAVTNERVILISGILNRVVRSVQLDTLTEVSLIERRAGAGSIILGPAPTSGYGMVYWPGGIPLAAELELAGHQRDVYRVIIEARRRLKQGS